MSKTTDTIAGLRFQQYPESNEVHVHDDARSLRFVADAKVFKEDVASAFIDLKAGAGATVVGGTSKEKLCLISDGKKIKAFVMDDKEDLTKEIESFIKKL
jgi:hypothetical protein